MSHDTRYPWHNHRLTLHTADAPVSDRPGDATTDHNAWTDAVCAVAWGSRPPKAWAGGSAPISAALAQLTPGTTWSIVAISDTTDAVWSAAATHTVPPWTVLCLSATLPGQLPLVQLLLQLRRRWPTLRIVVWIPERTADTATLVATCAAYGIYNVVIGSDLPIDRWAALIVRDGQWTDVAPYLTNIAAAPVVSSPSGFVSHAAATLTVAVVSGKGGVGKTGVIANLLAVANPWDTMAIDLDYVKPSLPLYFREANEVLATDLRRLLTQIHSHHRTATTGALATIEELTDDDRQAIQQYVDHAETVAPHARIVPGASRIETVMPVPPQAVTAAIVQSCQRYARFVFIDTPGIPTDPLWIYAVQSADLVVIVTTPEYAVLLETVDLTRKLDLLQVPRDRRALVVNKRAKWGYSTAAIRRTQLPGLRFLGDIAYDPVRWERSLQQHRPVALDQPHPWRALFSAITHESWPQTTRRWWRRKGGAASPPSP